MRLVCFAILITLQVAMAQDKKGCQDSPLITRFPGSVITDCKDSADQSFEFALAGAHYTQSAIPTMWRNSLMKLDLLEGFADRLLAHALVEFGT